MTTKENKAYNGMTPIELYSAVGYDSGKTQQALFKLKKLNELEEARQITVNYLLEMANCPGDPRLRFAYRAVYLVLRFVEDHGRWFYKEENLSDYLNGRNQTSTDAWHDPGVLTDHLRAARLVTSLIRTDKKK